MKPWLVLLEVYDTCYLCMYLKFCIRFTKITRTDLSFLSQEIQKNLRNSSQILNFKTLCKWLSFINSLKEVEFKILQI